MSEFCDLEPPISRRPDKKRPETQPGNEPGFQGDGHERKEQNQSPGFGHAKAHCIFEKIENTKETLSNKEFYNNNTQNVDAILFSNFIN